MLLLGDFENIDIGQSSINKLNPISSELVVGLTIITMFTYIMSPWYGQKIFSALSTQTAFYAVAIAAIFISLIYGIAIYAASTMAVIYPDIQPQNAIPVFIANRMPVIIQGVSYATLFFIAMTTLAALWNTIASVYVAHYSSDRHKDSLKFTRSMTLIISIISYILANIFINKIFDKMVLMNIPIASLAFPLLGGFYWKRVTIAPCIVSIIVGIAGGLSCYFYFGENDFIWYWGVYVIPLQFIVGIVLVFLLPTIHKLLKVSPIVISLVALFIYPFNLRSDNMNDKDEVQAEYSHTNSLINETSPYLLQHANNPVDWYPWAKEAFQKAEKENKPIFLSIGYSTCHWCHVMEEESFTNQQTADLLNKYFISIKVDKEELPAVNDIYMRFVLMTTGSGGWPLTVFLTPDLKPFYGGTYFPNTSKYGKPSFNNLLESIESSWQNKNSDINNYADKISEALNKSFEDLSVNDKNVLSLKLIDNAIKLLENEFDPVYGGFGTQPKFPRTSNLELFMQYYYKTNNKQSLKIIETSLDKMAYGGINDQIGGGFHRYTVDRKWITPHFEKMIYDNALLSKLYFNGYLLTEKNLYLDTGTAILDYVLREMQDETGGFYSAQDADSDGEEGKYYVWSKKQIYEMLGKNNADIFCRYYGITSQGNYEGKNILHKDEDPELIAEELKISKNELEVKIHELNSELLEVRVKRIHPITDDKILASINGLMISGFAKGYQVTHNKKYLEAAIKAADFVLTQMIKDDSLMHSYRLGKAKGHGYLEDYAFIASGVLDLYESTLDIKWLEKSKVLTDKMIELFWDKDNGAFYSTSNKHKSLITRPKIYEDSSVPSGNAVAALLMMKLSLYYNDSEYEKKADNILLNSYHMLEQSPQSLGAMLEALYFKLNSKNEIVLVGNIENNDTKQLLKTINSYYIPNRLISITDTSNSGENMFNNSYMFSAKPMIDNKTTVYICEDFACKQPVNSVIELKSLLNNK